MKLNLVGLVAVTVFLSGCGTYSTSSVKSVSGAAAVPIGATTSQAHAKKNPADVIVTETDITNHPYISLGDISVTVRKVTIFDSDPTQAKVADALREKAASMGADAVVLARYGTVGIGFTSWGVMDGNGRAVVFDTH